jgi:hypothetical protein
MMVVFLGTAFAEDSPSKVTSTSTVLNWTGQGATNGVLNTSLCDANNTQYLLWIFTTDHGSVDETTSEPVLHLGGTGSGDYSTPDSHGSSFHFTTPYFTPDPATLTANVTFVVADPGNGTWILTISHGCSGNQQSAISSVVTHVHDASHNPVTEVPLGSTVHDSATLSTDPAITSLPSGSSVEFYFYNDGHCDSSDEGLPGTTNGHASVDVSGADTTGGYAIDNALSEGPLAAGDYSYRAFFLSGDHTKVGDSTGGCEPFTVDMSNSKTSTSVVREDTNPNVAIADNTHLPLGTSVHDTATVVSDPSGNAIVPTGTVTYHFYNSIDCATNEITSLNTKTWPQDKTLDNSGNVPDSQSTGALGAGSYGFQAVYSGDSNYHGSTGACEPFVIDKGTLSISTDIHNASHNIVLSVDAGAIVHDTATLTGAVAGFTPDYSQVSFTFAATNANCTNSASVANAGTETVGSGTVARSVDSAPLGAGDVSYNASFAGDANYLPAGPATCEPLHIFKAPLTPGYWKTHLALNGSSGCTGLPSGTGCSSNGPFTKTYLPQPLGAYPVDTIQKAAAVFSAMSCSFSGSASNQNQQAIGCLAGHLLAAELNVANGANTCISPTIAKANAFLTNPPATTVTYGSLSATSINYTGPTATSYTSISSAQRALAIALKSAFDKYNNGGGC